MCFRDEFIGRVCAECEVGGKARGGRCMGRAGAARDDGENVNVNTMPVTAESVGQRGVLSRVSCSVCERLVSV
jgi:hypothetical protein